MTKITEEINKIVDKIDKNLSETLRRAKAEVLLDEIKVDLETLGKDAEEKYKKIVDEKVGELQSIIDKNLEEEPAWTTTQDDLSKIKKGLAGLQNEIKELERKAQEEERKLEEKLAEWETTFPGQNAKLVLERINKLEADLTKRNSQKLSIVDKIRGGKDKPSLTAQMSKRATDAVEEQTKSAKELIETAGVLTPVLTPLAGAADFVGAYTHSASVALGGAGEAVGTAGLLLAEKTGDDLKELTEKGMDMADKTREGAKEFTENMVKTGADSVENFRKGAENVTVESISLLKEGIRSGVGIKSKKFSLGVGISGADSLEKQLETKEEKIKDLEKRLAERKAEIAELTKKLEEQAEKGQGNLMNVIEMITNKK